MCIVHLENRRLSPEVREISLRALESEESAPPKCGVDVCSPGDPPATKPPVLPINPNQPFTAVVAFRMLRDEVVAMRPADGEIERAAGNIVSHAVGT